MSAAENQLTMSGADYGPAMLALNEKQRRYVCALFHAPKKYGSGVFAVKAAGYGTPTSRRQTLAQLAYQLNTDPKVQAAIAEVSQQHLILLGPDAVRALRKLLDNPAHRDHGRALGIVMDRVSPVQSTAVVKVEHEAAPSMRATAEIFERIMTLAARANVPPMIDVTPEKAAAS
jgi:hypothetical protein